MRIAKFFTALIIMIALSSYLSAVSMCLVVLAINPQSVVSPALHDTLAKVLYSTPVMIIAVYARVCALLSIMLAIAVVAADRFKLFGSQRVRMVASTIVCALTWLAFGRLTSGSACQQNANCDLALWVGALSFALTGALAGMLFAQIYKSKPND